jgi:hypothetical protein
MTRLIGAVLLLTAGLAWADGPTLGPSSTMTWTAPQFLADNVTPLIDLQGFDVGLSQVAGTSADGRRVDLGALGVPPDPPDPTVVSTALSALGLTSGQWYACVRAYNAGGDSACSNEVAFVYQTPTTMTLTGPTVTAPANATVTVTVSASGSTPTGSVSLTVDSGTPMSSMLNSGQAVFTVTSPAAGDHALAGSYGAQNGFGASSATGPLHVNPAPPHTLTITSGPNGTPNPVASGGVVNLSVTATDSFGLAISYAWSGSCPELPSGGTFNNPNTRNPSWIAPANTTGAQRGCTLRVTASAGDLSQVGSFTELVNPASPHTLTITSSPTGSPNPVGSGGAVNLAVTAVDSLGHRLSYAWAPSCPTLPSNGSLSNAAAQNPTWMAPPNTTGSQQSCTLQVTVSDGDGSSEAGSLVERVNAVPPTTQCGTERWSVKTGTDPDAHLVNLASVMPTTIQTMRSFVPPASLPANNRVPPVETTVFVLDATLTLYRLKDDFDYHLVVQDASGHTMIAEIPSPSCAGAGSLFAGGIALARSEFDSRLSATSSFNTANIPVRVTGVGFFDFLHGQTGVAPNGIELHPVLDVVFNPPSTASLVASVLPASRSVQVGTPATAFATMINAGSSVATGCRPSLGTSIPATFGFQTTDSTTNQLTGTPDTAVDIPGGGRQSFVFAVTPMVPVSPTDVHLSFACTNTAEVPVTTGVNTLLFSASPTPVPDIVALAATLANDGVVNIVGTTGTGAFSVATVNVGTSGSITASADTGSASLSISLSLCQTDPATGHCITSIGPAVTTVINAGATPTFAIFVASHDTVPFDPGNNRVFVRFKDSSGETRGATSVAVRTQ